MVESAPLSGSLEDYLEAIFHIQKDKQAARAKDISKRLKVSSSSVTGALRSLAQKKLINYAPYDLITLTHKGRNIARDVVRRHEILREFFVKILNVDEKEAEKSACKMEHTVSRTILERFTQFVEFMEACPIGGNRWIKGFGYQCIHGKQKKDCERCINLCLEDQKEGGKGVVR